MANVSFSAQFAQTGEHMSQITYNASATTITGTTYANKVALGDEVSGCGGARWIGIHLDVDINSANNVRVVCHGLHATGGDEYLVPYSTTHEYFEVLQDADYKVVAIFEVNKMFPIYKFCAYMGTDGGTDPDVESSLLTMAK